MKKILLIAVVLLAFCTPSFSAVTTTDGLITLDFYEDTQMGVENLWVLDFTVNDVDGPGGFEGIYFYLGFENTSMDFNNSYNTEILNCEFGYSNDSSWPYYPGVEPYPTISCAPLEGDLNNFIPVGTTLLFYALPKAFENELHPILGDFNILINDEHIQLTGPVGFAPVPEPVSIALFTFGAFILRRMQKSK